MDLRGIVIDGRDAEESKKVIEAICELPKGTITGISGYSNFQAKLNSDGSFRMGCRSSTSDDSIVVNVPETSTQVVYVSQDNSISFVYKGTRYTIGR